MTVSSTIPVARYTGTGSLTQFFWNWKMLPESVIEVRVNNNQVSDYTENTNNIIFNTAPANGDAVLIFRRTPLWMPEDYAFGRGFKSAKTELSMDRAYMISQEYEAGVVGAADLFTLFQQAGIWVNSERGKNAFVPLWPLQPPDPSILWAGPLIAAATSSPSPLAVSSMIFRPSSSGGLAGVSNATYTNVGLSVWTPWVDHEGVLAVAYWLRVIELNDQIGAGMDFTIVDGGGTPRAFGDEFDPIDTELKIATSTAIAPLFSSIDLRVEICKDNGSGAPDGRWAQRDVLMVLEYSL